MAATDEAQDDAYAGTLCLLSLNSVSVAVVPFGVLCKLVTPVEPFRVNGKMG